MQIAVVIIHSRERLNIETSNMTFFFRVRFPPECTARQPTTRLNAGQEVNQIAVTNMFSAGRIAD